MEIFDRENFDKMATDLSTFSYAEFLMKPTYSTYNFSIFCKCTYQISPEFP